MDRGELRDNTLSGDNSMCFPQRVAVAGQVCTQCGYLATLSLLCITSRSRYLRQVAPFMDHGGYHIAGTV